MWQFVANAVKTEYNAIRIWPQSTPPVNMDLYPSPPNSAYDDNRNRLNPPSKSPRVGVDRAHNLRISQRTTLDTTITLQGWPSRGGIIILDNATAPDFDFLHLDPLDPPMRRDADQDAEDAFCQALLRLGATWWDSEKRRDFVHTLEFRCAHDADEVLEEALAAVETNEDLAPSRRERGWVRVAWPSHPAGALCVLACEKLIMGRTGEEDMLRPRHAGLVSLARTMDERCAVLQRMGGRMYAGIDEYRDPTTFLTAWEDGHQGEKGPLVKYKFVDPASYGGHPGEALGRFNKVRSGRPDEEDTNLGL